MDFTNLLNQEIDKKRKSGGSKAGKPRFKKKKTVEATKVIGTEPESSRQEKVTETEENDNVTVERKEMNEINKINDGTDVKLVNEVLAPCCVSNSIAQEKMVGFDKDGKLVPDANNQDKKQQQQVGIELQSQDTPTATATNDEVANSITEEPIDSIGNDGRHSLVKVAEDNVNGNIIPNPPVSVIDQTLNEQLSNFDIINANLSKQEKIDQLKQLIKIEKYKQYLSQELQLIDCPLVEDDIKVGNTPILAIKIRIYLKKLIKTWESTNNNLDLLQEIKLDMIDLLYKLRKNKLPGDMITSLSTIIHYLNLHQFNQANQAYLKLSIGNVAWPIGIQNIGIHQRAADRKLTSKSANIMINDKTRRWIVSIKRLITWCENTVKS